VNHLGPFLLTTLLLPALTRHGSAAVVNLSSSSARFGDLDDLQSERRFTPNRAYGTSKLVALAAGLELARELDPAAARVVALDPGAMRTGMGEDLPGLLGVFNRRLKPNQQPIDRTAAAVVRAATDPSVPTGVWLDRRGRPRRLPAAVREPAAQRRALAETRRLVAAWRADPAGGGAPGHAVENRDGDA
jgi:NAD(P)-dependent dehydrogenase (short-subunit alcohol dehydrogenase family)